MRFNLNLEVDRDRFRARAEKLLEKKAIVTMSEKRQLRSLSQNAYLQVILKLFAAEYGERKEYVEQKFFKEVVNPEIFKTAYTNKVTGEVREDWRSTSDLNTKEMSTAIERFRNWSSMEAGIYIPPAEDKERVDWIVSETQRAGIYV